MATATTPANNSDVTPDGFPKYHAGEDLVRQMMINLTVNNRDPEAIEAAKHDREMKAIEYLNSKAAEATPDA